MVLWLRCWSCKIHLYDNLGWYYDYCCEAVKYICTTNYRFLLLVKCIAGSYERYYEWNCTDYCLIDLLQEKTVLSYTMATSFAHDNSDIFHKINEQSYNLYHDADETIFILHMAALLHCFLTILYITV